MRLELGQFVVVTRNMRELKKGTILKVTKLNKDLAIIEDIKQNIGILPTSIVLMWNY